MPLDDVETKIPLPKGWSKHVQLAIVHVVSLARVALVAARGRVAEDGSIADRLRAELDAAREEIALLREEMRLKDLRMSRVPTRRRPYFRPAERLAILQLRAARGWSKRETARRLLLAPATIVHWMRRLDEGRKRALLETPEPANRFPDFVRLVVRRLKVLCPTMGKKRIAQTLARAGLELGVSTVGRMLKENDVDPSETEADEACPPSDKPSDKTDNPIRASVPNECWQVDLTIVPVAAGLWAPWFPFALLPVWPYCWHVACVVDQYSRRVLDFAIFKKEPTALEMTRFLGGIVARVGTTPKFLISDKGTQLDCGEYRAWCGGLGIRPRYASTGSLRATAVVERFIRSLKDEWLRRIHVPLRRKDMRRELLCYARWFEESRPHQSLDGRTPREVYDDEISEPPTLSLDHPIELVVRYHDVHKTLPIVELKQAA